VAVPETDHSRREAPSGQEFLDMQASPEFVELRHRLRRFVFPMTAFFLVWYATYVATPVFGHVNVGLLIGLGQFLTTFLITGIYVRFANRELDPRAAAIRAELEGPVS
jgi:uncharacterized membrane protein (DUF485 family)